MENGIGENKENMPEKEPSSDVKQPEITAEKVAPLEKTGKFDKNAIPPKKTGTPKKEPSAGMPYTKTRISTIPLQAHPEKQPVKKPKKERNWKWFSFKREKKIKNKYDRDEVLAGSIKTVAMLVIAGVIAVFLAFLFLRGVIDIFALGKSDHQVQVTLGEYSGIEEIAEILHENGVIRYPTLFKFWAILKKDTDRNFEAGTYIVSPSMNYDELLDIFVPSEYERTQITIKIPEGSSVEDTIDIFLANGIGTREGFENVINNYPFDTEKYWFLKEIPSDTANRFWRLEGFLYPDTYFYYSDATELTAITKMLNRFLEMFKLDYMKHCEELGISLNHALTLASVITKETLNDVDYKPVSSVLNNRLKNPEFGYLEVDSPLAYFIRCTEGAYRELTDADRELQTPYNTYTDAGIPPSPICSPTISTIAAAMYPEETDYYYFLLTITEFCEYAKTKEEYDALVAKDLLDREEAGLVDGNDEELEAA